jgi:hypothetical protein
VTTSNIYNGLYYPIVEAITTTVIRAFLLRYTEDVDIEVGTGVEATTTRLRTWSITRSTIRRRCCDRLRHSGRAAGAPKPP